MAKIRVVIADDSDKMREHIRAGISADEQLEVVGMARNGLEACELVRMKRPDVLLLDLVMPKLDGISVMEHLTSNPDLLKIPYVIIVSAVAADCVVREAFAKGAQYYFVKPFNMHTLIDRVKTVVQNKNGNRRFFRKILPGEERNVIAKREMENEVADVFHQLGIPAHLKGYQYLKDAIMLVLSGPEHFYSITKEIYPNVAGKNHAGVNQVERAMRHAIEVGWCRGNIDVIDTMFGYTVQQTRGKPTNSEFIALIADKLRVEYSG